MTSGMYFAEDTIYRINPDRSVEFGMVVRVGGCSHNALEGPVAGATALKKRLAVLWGPRGQSGMVSTERVSSPIRLKSIHLYCISQRKKVNFAGIVTSGR